MTDGKPAPGVGQPATREHMVRHADGRPQPRTLRCTQVYCREGGEWKVVLRHADELPHQTQTGK